MDNEADKRKRDKRVSIKVSDPVHSWLGTVADSRGMTISGLCAAILGEYKENQQRLHASQLQAAQITRDRLLETLDIESLFQNAVLAAENEIQQTKSENGDLFSES